MKKIGLIGWRPFIENNKYYKEWLNTQIVDTIDNIKSIEDITYISSCNLLGCLQSNKDFQFYMCELINNKHILNLTFKNFKYFLEHVLQEFDYIITNHHNYPFMMLINKYAKKYDTKIIFVQHGMQNDIIDGVAKARIKGIFNKYTFSSYVALSRQLFLSLKIDPKVTYLTIKNIISKGSALIYPKYFSSAYKFNKLYVYSKKEKNLYLNLYEDKDINIILDADIKLYLKYTGEKYKSNKKYILYIDDEVIKDYNLYKKFNLLVDKYMQEGYEFYYLPRARNDQQPYYKKLNKNIKYLEKRTINKYIDNAEYVISTWSTLLNLPIYLEKNIILIANKKIIHDMKQINKYNDFVENQNITIIDLKNDV